MNAFQTSGSSPTKKHEFHGMSYRLEYQTYRDARTRCTNPKSKSFKNYGARGVKFLFTSFTQFFAELGPRPEGMSLDRVNNEGNYEPGNVHWATSREQARNKRKRVQHGTLTKRSGKWLGHYSVWLGKKRVQKAFTIGSMKTTPEAIARRALFDKIKQGA